MRKTALVTGGAKRIGREIVLFLAKQNYDILIHYNNSTAEAQNLKLELESFPINCTLVKANFSDETQVKKLADYEFDTLINNASVFYNDNIMNSDYSILDDHFKVNLFAIISLSKLFFEKRQALKSSGNIINILDYSIEKMPNNFFSYALSKRSLWEFTKFAAYKMAPLLRINAIALSDVMRNNKQSQRKFEEKACFSPLCTKPNIEEICQTVDFILKISSMTGQVIFLDGGRHLNVPELL